MSYICKKIEGIPYSRNKIRGNVAASNEWTNAVIEQTRDLPKVREACILRVTFLLPPDKFPKDFPFGPDLDNLLKRFCDALNETIFSGSKGKDSCIVSLNVIKTRVENREDSGALLEVLPINISEQGAGGYGSLGAGSPSPQR